MSTRATATLNTESSLCLTCSSSLPPRRIKQGKGNSPYSDGDFFLTRCCQRPICPTCLSSNPRLARYDPCLRCLDGVGAVGGSSKMKAKGDALGAARTLNVDGSVRDEDVFVLGDDDADETDDDGLAEESHSTPPPAYTDSPSVADAAQAAHSDPAAGMQSPGDASAETSGSEATDVDAGTSTRSMPSKYYIQPRDTLLGIALKVGVNGHTLCRINNLPPSTLRTTPHLLHTRTYLTLPSSVTVPSQSAVESPEVAARRMRERAQARLQSLAKEPDWRVAQAYVAVAEVPDSAEDVKRKEGTSLRKRSVKACATSTSEAQETQDLEERVLDRYMDDNEWEERERRGGRNVTLQGFPYFRARPEAEKSRRSWWPW
ncbi:hypothetical protein OBBRIDRAFT_788307 [Obba rivulosa]|uniref:LysM domain-containing protein n=1 Tax=Obba rivulosa TaxID=1052685 RepID=A0A8E2DT32_9APHY|nr:hypothetical protein OBBRIDRAFT_788307 [Obba rivulosa]